MAQYFCFRLEAVAQRVQYLSMVRETERLFEVNAVIEAFRKQVAVRRRQPIPL